MSDLQHHGASSSGQSRVEANHATEAMSTSRRAAIPRKVYIKVDMEGVSGVVSPEQVRPGNPEYDYARRMLMHDLKAVLDGVFAGGCLEAVIYDAHLNGRNIDLDLVDGRAVVISGRPGLLNGYFYGRELNVAPLMLVGCHARAGTPQALLPHTYDADIAALRLNGTNLGEVGMEAALAGEYGVPLAFVSGDSAAVSEARELLGSDVHAVEVKTAIGPTGGICLPAARTGKMLREAAVRAVRGAARVPPIVFQSPVTLDVLFKEAASANALTGMEGIERTEREVRPHPGPERAGRVSPLHQRPPAGRPIGGRQTGQAPCPRCRRTPSRTPEDEEPLEVSVEVPVEPIAEEPGEPRDEAEAAAEPQDAEAADEEPDEAADDSEVPAEEPAEVQAEAEPSEEPAAEPPAAASDVTEELQSDSSSASAPS